MANLHASADNSFLIRSWPTVNSVDMLSTSIANQALLFKEPSLDVSQQELEETSSGPDLSIPFSARFMITPEPRIDEQAFGQRLRSENLVDDSLGPWPLGFSILWHVVIFAVIFGFVQLTEVKNPFENNLSEPIEVVFGLSADLAKSLPDGAVADQKSEVEALKSLQQLPQLPKSFTIDAPTPVPAENAIAQPDVAAATPAPTVIATAIPTPTPTVQAVTRPTQAPVVERVDAAAVKKMKLEELAKRLEKEQRATGPKERAGTDKKTANDVFKRPNDIPINPLGRDLPKPPSSLGQAGSLQGKVNAQVRNDYGQAASLHMRKHWSLPDVLSFDSTLEVVLGFDINGSGRILGRIHVVKGSGNARFDEEAIKAVETAGPFPELPKEIGQKLSMKMKFSPNNINF